MRLKWGLFKLEIAAEDIVTTVNRATLYFINVFFSTKHHYTVVRYKPSVSWANLAVRNDLVLGTLALAC